MKDIIQLNLPKTIYLGNGSINKLAQEAETLGSRPLILCDPFLLKNGSFELIANILNSVNQRFSLYSEINSEPTQDYVYDAVKIAKNDQCDYIIAIGGGSCLDTAKAVAAVITNNVAIESFYGSDFQGVSSPLPLIAIPTTAGTGSEATDVTVITNTKTQVKMMLKNRIFLPEIAIVDPQFTKTVPKGITAATGLDALCHALESYVSIKSNSLTKMYSLDALKRILTNIEKVYDDGNDEEARNEMMIGSTEAGIAFSNASVTLVHGMSRPIGALFHVPHGLSNAMLLPIFLEFSQEVIKQKLSEIVDYIYPNKVNLDIDEKSEYLVQTIKKICLHLEVTNLAEWGIEFTEFERAVNKMAEDALASGSPQNNPKVPSKEEIIQLYFKAFSYK
ncbi:iron-containing alcohol dehydrogenase [Enterococcus sp. HY326]|uniref:iron-containing alcohol dehydrogenase n=1 Tax=Enterococcus sp. HY326 TaxID=2971265 RepID=UPI00223F6FB6|nr:iron-containing alcohol dehydrogenase [Enterococcus sp. HY326]